METPTRPTGNTGARAVEILAAMLEEAEADLAEAKAEKEAGTADAYYVDMRQSAVNALHDAHSAVRRAAHGRPATPGYDADERAIREASLTPWSSYWETGVFPIHTATPSSGSHRAARVDDPSSEQAP